MRNGAYLAVLAAVLSACGPWPQVEGPVRDETQAWPTLLPFEDLSAVSGTQTSSQSQAQALSARAAALRARANVMRRDVPDADAMDALRARLSS